LTQPRLARVNLVFLALAFLAELAAWSALGVAAYRFAGGGWQGWVAAVVTVLVVVTVWGLVASPRAKAPAPAGLVVKILVFGGSVVVLAVAGHPWWAASLGALILVALVGVRATTPRTDLPVSQ
jgi:hypothetical protein